MIGNHYLDDYGKDTLGYCRASHRLIVLSSGLTDDHGKNGRTFREVAIHEFLHAQQWGLDEQCITSMAEELDAYLDDLDL